MVCKYSLYIYRQIAVIVFPEVFWVTPLCSFTGVMELAATLLGIAWQSFCPRGGKELHLLDLEHHLRAMQFLLVVLLSPSRREVVQGPSKESLDTQTL